MPKSIEPKVGMGVTVCGYSDRYTYTITRLGKAGTIFWARADIATLDPSFKPDFHAGGFHGHVSNQNEQAYSYELGAGKEVQFRKTASGKWSLKGNTGVILNLRSRFHDYNF